MSSAAIAGIKEARSKKIAAVRRSLARVGFHLVDRRFLRNSHMDDSGNVLSSLWRVGDYRRYIEPDRRIKTHLRASSARRAGS